MYKLRRKNIEILYESVLLMYKLILIYKKPFLFLFNIKIFMKKMFKHVPYFVIIYQLKF